MKEDLPVILCCMDLQSEETYWSWWQTSVIPTLGRLRNEITNLGQLGNVVTPYLRKKSRDGKAKDRILLKLNSVP